MELHPQIERLNQIGIALSNEIQLEKLLALIVTEARGFTNADAGSLYTLEKDQLYFRIAQNDTLNGKGARGAFKPVPIPLDSRSIAGYVALNGELLDIEDVYMLSDRLPFSFNRDFDQKNNYRSQSMLVVPMKEPDGEVLGVLQLINAKNDDGKVVPFPQSIISLTMSLASQAAVAIRNARLISYIKSLFEALIRYSASAIDARSPHTAGHSRRVAEYATVIAQEINRLDDGPFKDIHFTADELERLSYSAWLHDLGKIGVPEAILDKHLRLPAGVEETIEERFNLCAASLAIEAAAAGSKNPREDTAKEREALKADFQRLKNINRANWLPDEDEEFLGQLHARTFYDAGGTERTLLTDGEMVYLAVKKGNLTPEEYKTMQGHVEHTLNIVKNIPFTGHLEAVPNIAASHHEMLNGTGYPRHLHDQEITLEARILAMVDIFDALTAIDRPYRKAAPPERACAILQSDVESGRLDKDVVELFVSQRLWERITEK
ncbi:HD domain-containing protein [Desulfatibacillum alkenivorans DSM 16219]|jgi:HD-GYP domain-containing protein (c-di-GMP phosphodiesterase class II)|uniref:HD domain-containing protein n=1 Tax=Desulfatibacillum alkenivorans DSM 16219 TaxID=1121393 RepID=A0A1M6MVR8_9BACT|nr:HD domain-containing phosphohydrolase [Desulfatibacillum alkenivorans]SHJ87561.1 HD domain-containing protein [Desulfatibacillum alkenivorans DSM 16219]